jgi:kinesin family protein 15
MLGDIEDAEKKFNTNRGMTCVFEHLFTRICKEDDARKEEKLKFFCKCSFLEIYN